MSDICNGRCQSCKIKEEGFCLISKRPDGETGEESDDSHGLFGDVSDGDEDEHSMCHKRDNCIAAGASHRDENEDVWRRRQAAQGVSIHCSAEGYSHSPQGCAPIETCCKRAPRAAWDRLQQSSSVSAERAHARSSQRGGGDGQQGVCFLL